LKWENQTCYREDNRGCALTHPAPGELSIHFFKQMKKLPMKMKAEQNLKKRKDTPREGGWFSPKAGEERSRARARNNEPAAHMDIERRVTMRQPCIARNAV
jgi:hypothetical protein